MPNGTTTIQKPYWQQKAEELEAQGKTQQAMFYRLRRPTAPGATQFGTAQPMAGQPMPISPQMPTAMEETIKKIQEQTAALQKQVEIEGITKPTVGVGAGAPVCQDGDVRTTADGKREYCEGGAWKPEEAPPGAPPPPKTPKQDLLDTINDRIKSLEEKAFARPEKTLDEIYQQAFKDAGLADLKKQIDDFNTKIADTKAELATETEKIQEDPWITRDVAEARINRLNKKYKIELDRIVNQRDLAFDTYKTGMEQAWRVATKTQAETEAGRKLTKEELDYYRKQLEEFEEVPKVPETFKIGEATYAWELNEETGKYEKKLIGEAPEKEEAKPTSYREWELAGGKEGTGMEYVEWLRRKEGGVGVDMTSYLANQGIPLTVATESGELTKSALTRVVQNDVPLDLANHIWANMQVGNSFETIREGMRKQGIDIAVLDKFVQALQGISGEGEEEGGIKNPYR